jgi:hypothetical protein
VTREELVTRLSDRAEEAERLNASAPLATVYRALIADLEALDGVPGRKAPDEMLTLAEAAHRAGVKVRWFRDNRARPEVRAFLRPLARGTVRVSAAGLARFLSTR